MLIKYKPHSRPFLITAVVIQSYEKLSRPERHTDESLFKF